MSIAMLGLGISIAQSQTYINSWENSLEGWSAIGPDWASIGFSTTIGVMAGSYSWEVQNASGNFNWNQDGTQPDFQGPSSMALTTLLANGGEVDLTVAVPNANDFGGYLGFSLWLNQPGGAGLVPISLWANWIGGGQMGPGSSVDLTFPIPDSVRFAMLAHPGVATSLILVTGGGGPGTMYLDGLRVTPYGMINSWEDSYEGWSVANTNFVLSGCSATYGVTAGLYSLEVQNTSGDYLWNQDGTAPDLTGSSSTALTELLANATNVWVDVTVPNANDFGGYLGFSLYVNQPGGAGIMAISQWANWIGGAQMGPSAGPTTLTFSVPQSVRTALLSNPSLPCSLLFCTGGGGTGTIYFDNLRAGLMPPSQANLWVRELWDDINSEEIPANASVMDDSSSVGFAASPWVVNPAEVNNCSLMAFRPGFPNEPVESTATLLGLPGTLDGSDGCMVQENTGFTYLGAGNSFWTDGDFMTRQLAPNNYINFQAAGEYWFTMTIANQPWISTSDVGSLDAQYVVFPASGWGGIGFADGSTTNADFVAVGVTGLNVWLGPTNSSPYHGDTNVSKALYISQGTLGQPGDPTTIIYNPANDPQYQGDGTNGYYTGGTYSTPQPFSQTNFSGGPYHINAYGPQTVGILSGDYITLLGHLTTHGDGTATLDAKYYYYYGASPSNYYLDMNTNNITWDCSYSFSFGGTMTSLLLFENGQFPVYVFGVRASKNFQDVVGLDLGRIAVSPLANTYSGYPINMTNWVVEAPPISFASPPPGYGTLNYQWYQNGVPISGATSLYLNIATASTNDPGMPYGTDAGTFSCVATDPSGTWGSVSNSVVITVTELNPPTTTGVQLFQGQNSVVVTFSEPNLTGADNTNNYVFNDGIVATGVNVINTPTSTEALVETTPLPVGTRVTLTVSGLTNVVGGVLTTTNFTFWTDLIQTGVANWDAWVCPLNEVNSAYFGTWVPANPYPPILTNQILTSWDGPSSGIQLNGGAGTGEDFGDRLYGWFIPPVTTNYVFFCCSDDGSRLSLSTNDASTNLFVIATESNWSPADEWTNINDYGNSPQRGDGTATGVGPTINNNPFVWDNSVAGQSPATACLQNRSDQFIVAFYDSTGITNGAPPGATNSWLSGAPPVANCVPASTTNFWPFRDTNGQALITLQAGQKYFMQLEHIQNTGGYDEGVYYKIASEPDPYSPTNSNLAGANIAGYVPFAPTISIVETAGVPQITYTGVLLAGTTVSSITNQAAISSNGPTLYVPSNTRTNMFYRTSE